MTKEEYDLKIKAIQDKADEDKKRLAKDYALSLATVKVGEVATDHIGSVRVEKILFSSGFLKNPEPVYRGFVLKKDGTPTKKHETRDVYHSNLKVETLNK